MLLLALDTSTRYSSIALCSDTEFFGEYTWYSGNNHNVELFEYTQRLCAQAQISLQQVELVAVAIGPGSFNGVRVALATAKALAFALRKPLVGVSTLDIIAFQQCTCGIQRPVCAILEAGRSEVYAASYMFDELHSAHGELSYRMERLGDYLLVTPQRLVAYLQEHASDWFTSARERQFPTIVFCGEISLNTQQALRSSLPQHSLFVRGTQAARRAVSLAAIALQQASEGHTDDPLALEPLYLRRPSITKSTRKQPLLDDPTRRSTGQHTGEREEGALRG
jgi:tRNA threonylcarbamoyladenosine biosynthesis protein TsaB